MTYKSIDTTLKEHVSNRTLIAFVPILDADESAKRELLMTPQLYEWCYQKDRSLGQDFKPNLRAFLGRFVKGGLVDNVDYMKTWRDDVWELRVQLQPRTPQKPNPGNTRIFGAFPRPDTFIAFNPAKFRSQFGDASDPRWDEQILSIMAKWQDLLPNVHRVGSRPFSNCLTFNAHDHYA